MDWFLYDNGLRRERVNISEMKNKRNHLHSTVLHSFAEQISGPVSI